VSRAAVNHLAALDLRYDRELAGELLPSIVMDSRPGEALRQRRALGDCGSVIRRQVAQEIHRREAGSSS
jgi:hypothetical protein